MTQNVPSMEFMKTLAKSVIASRPMEYPEHIWKNLLSNYPHLIITHPKINNNCGEKLKCSVLASVYDTKKCSNRTEGLLMLKTIPKQTSLVVFDFSGTGKSEGQYISYGNKQKQDIESVLNFLRKQYNFGSYEIWGRSMGAVAALMHSKQYRPTDVSFLVLDSPFSCFQTITKQIIKQKAPNLPHFLMQFIVMLLKFSCRKIQYSPFNINLNSLDLTIPAIFVYSQSDSLINCKHIFRIMQNYKGVYDTICIQQDHNQLRPYGVYCNIMNKMKMMEMKKQRLKTSMIIGKSKGIKLTVDQKCLKDITQQVNINKQNIYSRTRLRTSY